MTTRLWTNRLFFGDNLDILQREVADESIDLVYLDPPFNSRATYRVLYAEQNRAGPGERVEAFEDTWHWDAITRATFEETVTGGPRGVCCLLPPLRDLLGAGDLMAYLTMMAARLTQIHRVCKPTGTVYLHCDPTASHYLKIIMDSIWGPRGFQNEIIWCYTSGGVPKQGFARKHDVILRYTKTDDFKFNTQYRPYSEGTLQRGLTRVKGPRYRLRPEGAVMQDWWDDLQKVLSPTAKEMLGYPTQKPEKLLQRIIEASSDPGDVVLDPFCGCGTSLVVAERLGRRWIGVDVTHLALTMVRHRLDDVFGAGLAPYEMLGTPGDLEEAEALAAGQRRQFGWWALDLVDARPARELKDRGADQGADGYKLFIEAPQNSARKIAIQVRSDEVSTTHLRDLVDTVQQESAAIGVLLTLRPPSSAMLQQATRAGACSPPEDPGDAHPRIQVLTIQELLNGRRISHPHTWQDVTFRRASRPGRDRGERQ